MEMISLNNALSFSFPDGFRKMSEAEIKQLRRSNPGTGECLRDDDRHIIVSVAYKGAGFLTELLMGRDLIKNAQSRIAGAMRPYGYQLTGYEDRRVGDRTAQSFQYAYVAQGIRMTAECCAVKEGKAIYYMHLYVREACSEEGFRLWKQVLAEARWT